MAEPLVRQLLPGTDVVGESVIWDERRECLFWVDIVGRRIRRFDPQSGAERHWELAEFPTSIGLRADGGAVVGLTREVALWDFEGPFVPLATPEPGWPGNRLNEGCVAPDGSFWVGTMENNLTAEGAPRATSGKAGRYYRIDRDGAVTLLSPETFGITNGMAWLPDGRFVTADTIENAIYAFDISPDGKSLSNRRSFAEPFGRGRPDGCCTDAEGGIWTCRVVGGYSVTRTMADGTVDRVIDLPCSWPTSCTFGGPELATLFVTSARFTMSEAHLRENKQEGALFAFEPGVRGMPENRFA